MPRFCGACIAAFPILADPVDVKKGDQLCESVSQPSIRPDKVDPVLTSTTSAKIGKTAISRAYGISRSTVTVCWRYSYVTLMCCG